jgi:ParB family chromosome partitioning protein
LKISLVSTLDKQFIVEQAISTLKVYGKIPVKNLAVSQSLELAEEVRKDGQRLPIVCFKTPNGPEVILGELYMRILKLASMDKCVIVYIEDLPVEILHLIILAYIDESFMSIAEQIVLMHYLSKIKKISHAQLALRFRLSRTVVTNRIRLFNLPYEVMSGLVNDEITEGHARALLGLKRTDLIVNAYEITRKDGLSVRESEELVRRLQGRSKRTKQKAAKLSSDLEMWNKNLEEYFDTKVYIQQLLRGGRVIVTFKSKEDLRRILGKIGLG